MAPYVQSRSLDSGSQSYEVPGNLVLESLVVSHVQTQCGIAAGAGTNYVETQRVQLHANCRIRRIYFSDRLYTEEELPAEFKLYTRSAAASAAAAAAPPAAVLEDL